MVRVDCYVSNKEEWEYMYSIHFYDWRVAMQRPGCKCPPSDTATMTNVSCSLCRCVALDWRKWRIRFFILLFSYVSLISKKCLLIWKKYIYKISRRLYSLSNIWNGFTTALYPLDSVTFELLSRRLSWNSIWSNCVKQTIL